MHLFIIFLHLFTIVNKLILAMLFVFQTKNRVFNRLFAAIIISVIPVFIANLMHYLQVREFIERIWIASLCGQLYYPLNIYLLYTAMQIKIKFNWKSKLYLFSQVIAPVLLGAYQVFFLTNAEKESFINANLYYEPSGLLEISELSIFLVMLGNSAYFISFLRKSNKLTREGQPKEHLREKFLFIRKYVIAIIGVSVVMIGSYLVFPYSIADTIVTPISSNLLVFYLVYLAFDGRMIQKSPIRVKMKPSSSEKDMKTLREIRNIMEMEKLYLSASFSVDIIASKMGVSKSEISRILNTSAEQSFTAFVNHYRIEEVKERLTNTENDRLKVEYLGESVGFSSRATFYRVFKQYTGMTPTEYRDQEEQRDQIQNHG